MSNLGAYQKFTTLAKKFGGVEKFIGLIVAGSTTIGAAGGIGAFIGGLKIVKKLKAKKEVSTKKNDIIYKITTPGESNEGLKFEVGNEFRVLETDGDAILIEKLGDKNNPYFVDKKLLNKISNYL